MKPLIFTDLDDSLFSTRRKIDDAAFADAQIATRLKDGSPSGYITTQGRVFLDSLFAMGTVIPVTARSIEAFHRVDITWNSYAICAHGGAILKPDGTHCPIWHEKMHAAASKEQTPDTIGVSLEEAFDILHNMLSRLDGYRYWLVEEGTSPLVNLPLYIVAKHRDGAEEALTPIANALKPKLGHGWSVNVNGNNLSAMPQWLDKKYAVAHLLTDLCSNNRHGPVIGIGDSLSDIPFMQLCDYMLTPGKGQIANAINGLVS